MMVRVNKNQAVKKPVRYAALSSGTISHVWYEEEAPEFKRPAAAVKLVRAKSQDRSKDFDA